MSKSFVRQKGTMIVDSYNQPFTLRGVGIGGWLLLEGYMIKSYESIDRPRTIKQHISYLCGDDFCHGFFETWYTQFFTEADIEIIKNSGFNSIRIPIDYAFLYVPSNENIKLEKDPVHYQILDRMIALCKKYGLYVILDMHAAPGGQTGTNIDNSLRNHPDLFTSKLYQDQLCYIWQDIANRYKNETCIAAYDLLNEPLPKWFSNYNDLLIPLYKRVIQSIRVVDPDHLITLEGLHWSTDLSCFKSLLDDNLLLQFHKYWSAPDQESIDDYLTIRDALQVPIIMGEGGENNLQWYYAVFKLYDQLNISYNFWTYKKMDNHNSIISFEEPVNWGKLLASSLNKKEAIDVLASLLKNIKFTHSHINYDVINHLLRQDKLIIPAYGYDYYGKDVSYASNSQHLSELRRNDGMLFMDYEGKEIVPNFKQYGGEPYKKEETIFLKLHKNEWVQYAFNTKIGSTPDIKVVGVKESDISIKLTLLQHTKERQYYVVRIMANKDVQFPVIEINSV